MRCWDNDGEEYRSQYEALLRYDGERAEIRRMHEGEGDLTLSQTTEVPAYEPYPLFDESARDQVGDGASGGPYDFDVESVSTNTVSLSCALQESDEGDTVMELSMWVNGEHALTTVDTDPLPDDAEETEDRRRVGIVSRPGPGNEPLGCSTRPSRCTRSWRRSRTGARAGRRGRGGRTVGRPVLSGEPSVLP